jgi:hypothetical protein
MGYGSIITAVNKFSNFLKKHNIKVPKLRLYTRYVRSLIFKNASDRKWKLYENQIVWKYIEKNIIVNEAFSLYLRRMKLGATTFKGYNPKRDKYYKLWYSGSSITFQKFEDSFFLKFKPGVRGKNSFFRSYEEKKEALICSS